MNEIKEKTLKTGAREREREVKQKYLQKQSTKKYEEQLEE